MVSETFLEDGIEVVPPRGRQEAWPVGRMAFGRLQARAPWKPGRQRNQPNRRTPCTTELKSQ